MTKLNCGIFVRHFNFTHLIAFIIFGFAVLAFVAALMSVMLTATAVVGAAGAVMVAAAAAVVVAATATMMITLGAALMVIAAGLRQRFL